MLRLRLGRWIERWQELEPDAVRNFAYEFEDRLIYLNAPDEWQSRLKTTNPIERFIRELNKKSRRVGIFPSARSWERARYLAWRKLETQGYAPTRPKSAPARLTPNT
ncbi:MAG: transposase [Candidatus Brocadiae bacterium]|nr:transposase [Candidatus Brocadiia bacterium]